MKFLKSLFLWFDDKFDRLCFGNNYNLFALERSNSQRERINKYETVLFYIDLILQDAIMAQSLKNTEVVLKTQQIREVIKKHLILKRRIKNVRFGTRL